MIDHKNVDAVWGSDKGTYNRGGSIVDTLIVGNEVGYGTAVDDFVITGNRVKIRERALALRDWRDSLAAG